MTRFSTRAFPRLLGIALALTGLAGGQAGAQLRLNVSCDRGRYIIHEPVQVTLRIRNDSGNALSFGEAAPGRPLLSLVCQREDATTRETREADALIRGLELAPGQEKTLTFAINDNFGLARPGRFAITAQVGHPRFQSDLRTQPAQFEVREGTPEWSHDLGVPALDPEAPIRDRRATLLVFPEEKFDIYCLQIQDDDTLYALLRLGRRIIAAPPQCEIDAMSNIHVLMRLRSRLLVHRVYDYNGSLRQQKFYGLSSTTPELYRDTQTGRVSVVGGKMAQEGVDYTLSRDDNSVVEETP